MGRYGTGCDGRIGFGFEEIAVLEWGAQCHLVLGHHPPPAVEEVQLERPAPHVGRVYVARFQHRNFSGREYLPLVHLWLEDASLPQVVSSHFWPRTLLRLAAETAPFPSPITRRHRRPTLSDATRYAHAHSFVRHVRTKSTDGAIWACHVYRGTDSRKASPLHMGAMNCAGHCLRQSAVREMHGM